MSTIRVKELARILKGENTSDDIQFYHDIEDNYDDNWFITSMYEDDEGDLIIESSADEDETLSVGDILDGLDDYSAGTKIYLYDSDDWRKRSIPTHSNGSIHSLLSPKIGLRSA